MASWQGRLFNKMVFLSNKISNSSAGLDIVKHRLALEKFAKYFAYKKGVVREKINIGHLSAEWLYTADAGENVILYLHGGAFVFGSTNTHNGIMAKIACLTSFRVLGVNYRLAPEHPFPAGLDDALLAYHWLLQQGIPAKSIILAGDSSGGNLAISMSLLLRDSHMPMPAAIACLSPWVDLTLSGESIVTNAAKDRLLKPEIGEQIARSYLQNHDPASPLASPLFADLTNLPPLYIQVSDTEMLLSDATRLAQKASLAGVDVKLQIYSEMMHSWQFMHRFVPEAKQALNDLAEFILKEAQLPALDPVLSLR